MAATLTPTSNYVDVGANIGDMLVHALAYAPEGRHIAVEPLPELCDELRRRHRTVDVHNLALSNAQGETEFTRVCDAEALSGFLRPDLGTSFKTERLISRADGATRRRAAGGYVPHFVKIDVEGAEVQVLEGAFETLRRHKPVAAFEHGHGAALHGKRQPMSTRCCPTARAWPSSTWTATAHSTVTSSAGRPPQRDHGGTSSRDVFVSDAVRRLGPRWRPPVDQGSCAVPCPEGRSGVVQVGDGASPSAECPRGRHRPGWRRPTGQPTRRTALRTGPARARMTQPLGRLSPRTPRHRTASGLWG